MAVTFGPAAAIGADQEVFKPSPGPCRDIGSVPIDLSQGFIRNAGPA
jgi:hypothetical protein